MFAKGLINRKLALPLYTSVLVLYIYSMHISRQLKPTHLSEYVNTIKRFRSVFFTGWNFVAQIIFLTVIVIDELLTLCNFATRLQKTVNGVRSFMYHAIIVPNGSFVILFFWTLFIYDRELIFPKELDSFFPLWLNHVMHSLICVPIIVELLLPKRQNFISFRRAFTGLSIYLAAYQVAFLYVYFRHGVWIYVIFSKIGLPGTVILGIVQILIETSLLKLSLFLQNKKRLSKRHIT